MKETRGALKDHFQRGATPTQEHFENLIDSLLNQEDDGVSKSPDDPLSIKAVGDEEGLINFYRDTGGVKESTWQFKQNPGKKAGLSIHDAAAEATPSRLFIESGTGNVGIGTTEPGAKLHVSGASQFEGGRHYFKDSENKGRVRVGAAWGVPGFYSEDGEDIVLGIAADRKAFIGTSGNFMTVQGDGNVGIGTTTPGSSKLRVANSATDYADILFSGSGMGQLQFVGWSSGWNINTKTNGKHLYMNRDAGSNSNVLVGRNGKELFVRGSDGNVGIGTTAPGAKLEVAGNIIGTNLSVAPTNTQRGAYFLAGMGDFNHAIYNNNSNIDGEGQWDGSKWNCFAGLNVRVGSGTKKSSAFYIKSDGNVGIGTTDPKAPLHVATRSAVIGGSNFRSGAGNTQYWSIGCWEWVGAQGFKSWSDARVKMNPQKLDTQEALRLINKLNLVDFEHIPTYHSGQKGRGVYAQEIQDLLPDAVSTFPEMELDDGTALQDFLSVDYDWIFVTGMAALQELSKQNQALQQTVAELKTEMRRLHKNGRVSA